MVIEPQTFEIYSHKKLSSETLNRPKPCEKKCKAFFGSFGFAVVASPPIPKEPFFYLIEMTGTIDEHRQLILDGSLPFSDPKRVRVIVLSTLDDEVDELSWLHAAT